jgi:hypothetical protein
MQKRKFARKRAGGVSLPEMLDQLELALAGTPARTSVSRALSDLNRRLGSASGKTAARTSRSASPPNRRRNFVAVLINPGQPLSGFSFYAQRQGSPGVLPYP